MTLHVDLEVLKGTSRNSTSRTGEGRLVLLLLMAATGAAVAERFSAGSAFIWLLTRVDAHVPAQSRGIRELFLADLAVVHLLPRVDQHMSAPM